AGRVHEARTVILMSETPFFFQPREHSANGGVGWRVRQPRADLLRRGAVPQRKDGVHNLAFPTREQGMKSVRHSDVTLVAYCYRCNSVKNFLYKTSVFRDAGFRIGATLSWRVPTQHRYAPLPRLSMRRQHCLAWLETHGYRQPLWLRSPQSLP